MKNFIFLLFIGVCISCQSHSETDKVTEVLEELINVEDSTRIENSTDVQDSLPPTFLAGTQWKYVGIVNIETGDTTELKPKDCEYCYTLTFETDYTANAYSISGTIAGSPKLDLTPESLNRNPDVRFVALSIIEKYEKDGKYYEVNAFRHLFFHIESFTVTKDELKFFYFPPTGDNSTFGYYFIYSNNQYSLFKRIDL
ncbi:MAG: hypothetical protein LBE91_20005 [Tannerella sp.]|jgi:hypothetical protein|nr:hypothetical protein [Tannerella sp.]